MKYIRVIALLTLLLSVCSGTSAAALKAGVEAPDFTLKTTTDEEVTLSDFRGQVVILHFWKSN